MNNLPLDGSRNYYLEMQTGIYSCIVDKMSLYNPEDVDRYSNSTYLGLDGEKHTVENEMVNASLTILQLIDIHTKGYPIQIINPNMIKEIVEITYSHITMCIRDRDTSITGDYSVDVMDLVNMENFIVDILAINHSLISDIMIANIQKEIGTSKSMRSIFADVPTTTAKPEIDLNEFRRISKLDDFSYSAIDIINNY